MHFSGHSASTNKLRTAPRVIESGDLKFERTGTNMAIQGENNGASGGFRARMMHYLYSGERKHVLAGMAIVTFVFGAPWFLKMNKGAFFLDSP